jgi:hypothetical protein
MALSGQAWAVLTTPHATANNVVLKTLRNTAPELFFMLIASSIGVYFGGAVASAYIHGSQRRSMPVTGF